MTNPKKNDIISSQQTESLNKMRSDYIKKSFEVIGTILNKSLGKDVIRYRFLMKRKDSESDEKFISDVSLSSKLFSKVIGKDYPQQENYINHNRCYMSKSEFGNRFELVHSKYNGFSYQISGTGKFYNEQIIIMRDNETGIEYEFNTKDRYKEVNSTNKNLVPENTHLYSDIEKNFEKASLIKANYPIEKEKDISIMDLLGVMTKTEKKNIAKRLSEKYDYNLVSNVLLR